MSKTITQLIAVLAVSLSISVASAQQSTDPNSTPQSSPSSSTDPSSTPQGSPSSADPTSTPQDSSSSPDSTNPTGPSAPTGPPQLSRVECAAGHSAALGTLFACFDNGYQDIYNEVIAELQPRWDVLSKAVDELCKSNQFTLEERIEACASAKELLAHDESPEIIQNYFNLKAPEVEAKFRQCMATFQATESGLTKSCDSLGLSGNRSLYCSAVRLIASSCAAHCKNKCNCAQWFSEGSCTLGRIASFNLNNIGCEFVPAQRQKCFAACDQVQDKNACRADCSDYAARSVAACLGIPASTSPPKKSGTDGSKKPTLTKPAIRDGRNSSTSAGVKSNNLDRFGLGPSFVTSDPSLPNQRGAGKAAQGGSAKAKTTTSLAKPSSTDSKRPSVDPNARIIKPTEQIK